MENQEKNAEEKIIITRDETLYHEQLAKGCGVLGCIIGAIIYFLSGNFNIALIVAICSSIVFIILIMIGQKKEKKPKKPLKTDNLSKAKEKSKRYITQLAKNSRSNTKISRWNKILFCLIFGLTFMGVTLGFYELIKMDKKLEKRRAERLRLENPSEVVHEEVKKEVKKDTKKEIKEIKKKFEPRYTVIENENNIQRIFVPLGLNENSLKENLLHAAKAFQKDINSPNVIVFAYRSDDLKHEDFTAGKCTITEGSEPVFEFAKVYSIYQSTFNIGENVLINRASTPLYKESNAEKILRKLKKDTKVKVLDYQRTFSTDEILDIYKIEFYIKNKKITGWVLGNDLRIVEKIERLSRPSNGARSNPSLYTWKYLNDDEKIATCSEFLLKCQRKGVLKIKISSLNLLDRSSDLVICVDAYIKGIRYDRQYFQDFEDIAIAAMLLMGWIE